MSTALIRVTFGIITHESAEEGEYAETGWVDEEGTPYSFREAVALLRGMEPSASRYHTNVWYTDHGTECYRSGDIETRSYHVYGSESFQRRLFAAVSTK